MGTNCHHDAEVLSIHLRGLLACSRFAGADDGGIVLLEPEGCLS